MVGWGSGDAFPGTSLACAWQQCSSHPHSVPFPNYLLCLPLQLKLLFPSAVARQPTMSSQRRQFLPVPSTSGSQLARAPTSLQMGHCTLDLGPTGGKRRALSMALSVTP